MIEVSELRSWLASFPADAGVFIDDGGLTLAVDCDDEAYISVGGLPEADDDE